MGATSRQTYKTAHKGGLIGQVPGRPRGTVAGMRRSNWSDPLLTVLGLAAAGWLGYVSATAGTTIARLAAINTLLALGLSAAGSAAHRWQQRRRSPDGRSTPPAAGRVLGYAAAGAGIGWLLCTLLVVGLLALALGGSGLGVFLGVFFGVIAASPLALVVGIPIGLAAGLTNACTSPRPR
jgi:hypothetical protein